MQSVDADQEHVPYVVVVVTERIIGMSHNASATQSKRQSHGPSALHHHTILLNPAVGY
jgi:tRNA(Arg) A34 adenosine deaminase TadA